MMFMVDSERAAGLAKTSGIPVGLHVNLSQQYDGPNVSREVVVVQAALVRKFRPRRIPKTGYRIYPGRWRRSDRVTVAASHAIETQLAEFRRLYGKSPTHIDGHHDVHLCASVWPSAALLTGVPIRNTHRYYVRERGLRQRFAFPEVCISMQDVVSSEGRVLHETLQRDDVNSVEVSQHPNLGERAYLLSETWLTFVKRIRTGSFLDLPSRRMPGVPDP